MSFLEENDVYHQRQEASKERVRKKLAREDRRWSLLLVAWTLVWWAVTTFVVAPQVINPQPLLVRFGALCVALALWALGRFLILLTRRWWIGRKVLLGVRVRDWAKMQDDWQKLSK